MREFRGQNFSVVGRTDIEQYRDVVTGIISSSDPAPETQGIRELSFKKGDETIEIRHAINPDFRNPDITETAILTRIRTRETSKDIAEQRLYRGALGTTDATMEYDLSVVERMPDGSKRYVDNRLPTVHEQEIKSGVRLVTKEEHIELLAKLQSLDPEKWQT